VKLIDVHCHLQEKEFGQDLDQVIQRAKEGGVSKVIISTLSLEEIYKAYEMVKAYQGYVYLTVGYSPTTFNFAEIKEIQEFIRKNKEKIVGIGEVGLDYYWGKKEEREVQKRLFEEWIFLAKEVDLPLVVHSRSAGKDALEFLLENPPQRVLMHAFDGKRSWAKKGEEAGFYFSIPTSVVHSIQKQKLVESLKIESMMLETDSPVLSPVKGERNEPVNLKYALEKVSSIKSFPQEEVAEIITYQTAKFFNLNLN